MTALKPGMRCECRDYATTAHLHTVTLPGALIAKPEGGTVRGPSRTKNADRCPNDAVRLVTVPNKPEEYYARIVADVNQYVPASAYDHVPMCEPCAQFHEAKAVVK